VEVDAPDGAVVLIKPVEERAHAVVPELRRERERERGGGDVSEVVPVRVGRR